jgi:hypothetical protein
MGARQSEGDALKREAVAAAVITVGVLGLIAAVSLGSGSGSGSGSERVAIRCAHKVSVHPSRCLVTGASGAAGSFVYLVGLAWKGWGDLKARADGYLSNPERHTKTAVKVLISGRTSCGGESFYQGLRLMSKGRTVLRLRMLPCAN